MIIFLVSGLYLLSELLLLEFIDNLEDSSTRTQSIYNRIGRPIIESVLKGYHGAILCYG